MIATSRALFLQLMASPLMICLYVTYTQRIYHVYRLIRVYVLATLFSNYFIDKTQFLINVVLRYSYLIQIFDHLMPFRAGNEWVTIIHILQNEDQSFVSYLWYVSTWSCVSLYRNIQLQVTKDLCYLWNLSPNKYQCFKIEDIFYCAQLGMRGYTGANKNWECLLQSTSVF